MKKTEIAELREYLGLPSSVSDQQIEQDLKGFLWIAAIRLREAKRGLHASLLDATRQTFKDLREAFK